MSPTSADYAGYKYLTAHDKRFHSLIARLSGSEQVRQAFERTHCHLHSFRLHHNRVLGADVIAEHHGIVDAITSGDPDAAEKAMRRHIENSMEVRLHTVFDGSG